MMTAGRCEWLEHRARAEDDERGRLVDDAHRQLAGVADDDRTPAAPRLTAVQHELAADAGHVVHRGGPAAGLRRRDRLRLRVELHELWEIDVLRAPPLARAVRRALHRLDDRAQE